MVFLGFCIKGMVGGRYDYYDYFYKIVLIGDFGVGKFFFLFCFMWNEFDFELKLIIGVEFVIWSI